MPRGVPKTKVKGKRGASKLSLDSFIQASVKYLRRFSADARALVLHQITKDLRTESGKEPKVKATRKPRTVAQEQREVKNTLDAGASTTENTSGGAKRTQPKVKDKKGNTGSTRKTSATSADDVSGIPGVAEESTSH